MTELPDEQIRQWMRHYIREKLDQAERGYVLSPATNKMLDELHGLLKARVEQLKTNDYSAIKETAKKILTNNDFDDIEEESFTFKKVSREALKADINRIETEIRHIQGEYSDYKGHRIPLNEISDLVDRTFRGSIPDFLIGEPLPRDHQGL